MISNCYKCIFVRISKVASTSVQGAFYDRSKLGDKLLQRFVDRGEFSSSHFDLEHYHREYSDRFDNYFKFAFVRNPWDRAYSLYRYLKYKKKLPCAQCGLSEWLEKCADSLAEPDGRLFGRDRYYFVRHLSNQLDWLEVNGEIRVDFIGRFESLQTDFEGICQDRAWNLSLPTKNKSVQGLQDFRLQYCSKSVDYIQSWHAKDIDYFKYSFEE